MIENLSSCFIGGYNKLDTLSAIDCLMQEIYQLETAAAKKDKGEEYEIPPAAVPDRIRNSAWGGFNKENVDSVLTELNDKISELREKLG